MGIGTITGSIIGLIPGVGGQIAGLVAYDQSKKFSPDKDKFGTGHPEGLIAAESANNAMVGPSLVPLLTLSIPGSPTAAVLLGGLLIHGIFPGTDLFDNHPDVAWTFINSMLIGQVLMCIFGLYVAGLAARVAQVPQSMMAAIVLGLAVFGSYSVQSSMGDVYVMAALGVMMYFLERFGFSAAPLVLGLILGPIAESNFIQGSMIAAATDGLGAILLNRCVELVPHRYCGSFGVLLRLYGSQVTALHLERGDYGMSDMTLPRLQHVIGSGIVAAVGATVCYISYTQSPSEAFSVSSAHINRVCGLGTLDLCQSLLGMDKGWERDFHDPIQKTLHLD